MLNLDLPTLITRIIILVIAFTFHEFSHAYVASRFGDNTPEANGRLTLNPLAHLDIMGSLLLIIGGFGWAKPVPINPYEIQRRSPAGVMWVSLAGPMSNFLLAIIGAIPLRMGLLTYNPNPAGSILPTPYEFLLEFIFINLTLMVFNLIPLAPLDGEKIAEYFFPPPLARIFDTIRPYGPMVLLVLVLVLPLVHIDFLGAVMFPVVTRIARLLIGIPA